MSAERRPLASEDRRALRTGFVLIGVFTAFCIGIFSFAFYVLDLGRGGDADKIAL